MEKLIVAFATDDRKNFTSEHFGEAKEYLVYEISKTGSNLEAVITNISPEEKMHGDPNKAKGVAHLLKPFNVQILVNKAFGRNIIKMQQKFVVILSNTLIIDEAINNIKNNFDSIVAELNKGETRNYLRL